MAATPGKRGFPGDSDDKVPACAETQVRSLSQEDPLEKGMATHSGILAWRIPWTEEPGGPLSIKATKGWTQWNAEHTEEEWQKGYGETTSVQSVYMPQLKLLIKTKIS